MTKLELVADRSGRIVCSVLVVQSPVRFFLHSLGKYALSIKRRETITIIKSWLFWRRSGDAEQHKDWRKLLPDAFLQPSDLLQPLRQRSRCPSVWGRWRDCCTALMEGGLAPLNPFITSATDMTQTHTHTPSRTRLWTSLGNKDTFK